MAILRGEFMSGALIKWIFTLLLLISIQTLASVPGVPNKDWTPGSVCTPKHSDFKEYRYKEKIAYCYRNVSFQQRAKIYDLYGIPEHCRSHYTIDHLIPLSIGGDNSFENLWPEHKLIKAQRPDLELHIYQALRNGKIKQREAIQIILKEKKEFDGAIDGKSECDQSFFRFNDQY